MTICWLLDTFWKVSHPFFVLFFCLINRKICITYISAGCLSAWLKRPEQVLSMVDPKPLFHSWNGLKIGHTGCSHTVVIFLMTMYCCSVVNQFANGAAAFQDTGGKHANREGRFWRETVRTLWKCCCTGNSWRGRLTGSLAKYPRVCVSSTVIGCDDSCVNVVPLFVVLSSHRANTVSWWSQYVPESQWV